MTSTFSLVYTLLQDISTNGCALTKVYLYWYILRLYDDVKTVFKSTVTVWLLENRITQTFSMKVRIHEFKIQ